MDRHRRSARRPTLTLIRQIGLLVVLAVGLALSGGTMIAGPASADPVCQPDEMPVPGPNGTIICVDKRDPGPGDPGPRDPDPNPEPIPEGTPRKAEKPEQCTPNNPNPSEDNPGCGGDITTCTAPEVPTNWYWRNEVYYRATGWQPVKDTGTAAGDWWTYDRTECSAPAEPAEPTEGDVITALAQFNFKGQAPTIEPENGRTLVNLPTNFYVNPATITEPLPVGPWTVQITATPERYEWDFGDGKTRETTIPGDKYPNMLVKHTYKKPAERINPKVTIWYHVEWSFGGGAPQPIANPFPATDSPSTPLQVLESKPRLGDK